MTKFILFLLSFTSLFNSVFGTSVLKGGYKLDGEKLTAAVTASNEARIEKGTVSGAHEIVIQSGKTVLDEVFGFSSADGTKLEKDALYRIASMTKPVTAVALLIEYSRGNLDIYDDVSKYIPAFADMTVQVKDKDGSVTGVKKAENSIKVYQLVSHFSGVGEVDVSAFDGKELTVATACEWLSRQPLHFEPGTQSEYSTGAFDVAAHIIELTSGMEFEEYLKANIFDKLGMTDTTFEPDAAQKARFVKMHGLNGNTVVDIPMPENCVFGNFPETYHAAGAALASTAYDYLKFAKMLLNGGKAEDGTEILPADVLKLMSTPVPDNNKNDSTKWGLAVRVVCKNGNLPKGTFGWSGAYGSHFWIDPANEIAAVYMKNSSYDGGAGNQSATEFENDVMGSLSLKRNR